MHRSVASRCGLAAGAPVLLRQRGVRGTDVRPTDAAACPELGVSEVDLGCAVTAEPAAAGPETAAPPEYGPPSRLVTRTQDRHAAVTEPRDKGYSLNAIDRELGLGFRTVQRFARAATPEDLLVETRNLDRFKPYVHHRWNAGATEATVLHTELAALGWRGSLRSVQRYLQAPERHGG